MTNLQLHINAVDTLMFRDGRPFNQNDAGASEATSVFPPYPPTLVGAVRAALWQGPLKGKWCETKLGNGTNWQERNVLGPLSFDAPLLLKNEQPVFPVPLHILEGADENGGKHLTRLKPGSERNCDYRDKVKLPVPEDTSLVGIKTIENRWVNFAGMQKILNGCVPDNGDFIKRTELWRTEPRVGIGIDIDEKGKAKKPKTRTTSDGHLYMASHVRMVDDISLYVNVNGWSDGFDKALRPLAGEHRMAEIKPETDINKQIKLPAANLNGETQFCLIALSPVVPDKDGNIAGLGEVITACLGKLVSIGGWDSRPGSSGPIPLRRCYPAGSVWFIEGKGKPPGAIGQATEWGFGQMLIGKV